MKLRYDPRARDELTRAAEYFDEQEIGLGNRFFDSIEIAVKEIASTPLMWPISKYGTRKRILVTPFPYTIHYKIVSKGVVIVAIAHQNREPAYWKGRLE